MEIELTTPKEIEDYLLEKNYGDSIYKAFFYLNIDNNNLQDRIFRVHRAGTDKYLGKIIDDWIIIVSQKGLSEDGYIEFCGDFGTNESLYRIKVSEINKITLRVDLQPTNVEEKNQNKT